MRSTDTVCSRAPTPLEEGVDIYYRHVVAFLLWRTSSRGKHAAPIRRREAPLVFVARHTD